jgi:hypothetical protein
MSMRSSIVIGLVGGAVGFGGVMIAQMNTGSYRLIRLGERTDKARKLPLDQTHLNEAEAEFRYLLDSWIRMRGAHDLETIFCRRCLADIYEKEGEYAKAEAEYRAFADSAAQKFGENYGSYRTDVAYFLQRVIELDKAEVEWRILLSDDEKSGALNQNTLGARNCLIDVLEKQEKYAETLPLLEVNMTIVEPIAAEQRKRLVTEWIFKENDWRRDEALLQAKKALNEKRVAAKTAYEDARKNRGEKHPQTLALKTEFEDLKSEKARLPEYWWRTRRGL